MCKGDQFRDQFSGKTFKEIYVFKCEKVDHNSFLELVVAESQGHQENEVTWENLDLIPLGTHKGGLGTGVGRPSGLTCAMGWLSPEMVPSTPPLSARACCSPHWEAEHRPPPPLHLTPHCPCDYSDP